MDRQHTVLIVDDEPGFRKICELILQRAGYATLTASNVAQARDLVERHQPDALILDDDMPGMSGSDLAKQLSRSPLTSNLPVIMFSASERVHNPNWLRSIGATAAVRKPCLPADLLAPLERSLKQPAGV